jgi:hypothetical protein
MDCVVKSWILDSLTDDLAEIVSSQGATARDAWLAVESQFLGNRETRAIQLETKFHNFVQGDLSVIEYCRRLKKMTNDLTALGEVVTDRTLILNVLRGLNKRFTHVGALLRHTRPFPTFLEVKDDLSLEELTLGSHPHHRPLHSPPPQSSAGNDTSSKPNRRDKRGCGGGGGSGGGRGGGAAAAPRSSITLPSSSRSNRLEAPRPSASPPEAGPPSTTLERAPYSCVPVPAILLWWPYLDRRSSSRRSSPNNSLRSSRRCSRTSFLLLQLAPLRVANGGRPAPTTPWLASPSGIHSRSPPCSGRQH